MSRDQASTTRLTLAPVLVSDATLAALLTVVATGLALALVYDPASPLVSVALIRLANPAAAFLRNLHYWATQALLVLSIVHVWQHLARAGDRRMRVGAWIRVSLLVPVLALLAWSGFVLKGDVEAQQALRVVFAAATAIPFAGPVIAGTLIGDPAGVSLVFLHHVATFTIIAIVIAIEHGRQLWPRVATMTWVAVPLSLLALVASPSLHDGIEAVVKGPWIMLGLQEAFHWSSRPLLVIAVTALPLLVLVALRWMTGRARTIALAALVACAVAYGALSFVAWAFRGAGWQWTTAWHAQPRAITWGWVAPSADAVTVPTDVPIPTVLGRPEGCLACHTGVTGLSAAHDPAAIGCASCHGGDPYGPTAQAAHAGMRVVPGNLTDAQRSCGGECHPSVVARVDRSIMTTLAGIVAVNRATWGEHADGRTHDIRRIGYTPADSHLRGLCASCHLGAAKDRPAPVSAASRGGGCTACHVRYSPEAAAELQRTDTERQSNGSVRVPARVHPDVTLRIDNTACFGCHSRSGRIALSYEGWYEADAGASLANRRTRSLADGRVLVAATEDAHWTKRMTCVDCHTAREVMGDGTSHARKAQQARITCDDCHLRRAAMTRMRRELDDDDRRIASLRQWPSADRPLLVAAAGDVLVNAFVDVDGATRLARKGDGQRLELRPPATDCLRASHARVSCIGCHTAWAPRCPECHTRFDPDGAGFDLLDNRETRGEWKEEGGHFSAQAPTIGARRLPNGTDTFEPFVPGMIATLEHRGGEAQPTTVFRRLYARAFPHTVTKAGRSCTSCHNDPVALGYGSGELRFETSGAERGHWRFAPANGTAADGLPADAWIGMFTTRTGPVSTRDDVRPLSNEEQRKVLAVGACLTCHAPESRVMRGSLDDFAGVQRRMTAACVAMTR